MSSMPPAVVSVSIDGAAFDTSASTTRRADHVSQLVEQFDVPSNWVLSDAQHTFQLPRRAEFTPRLPIRLTRGGLIRLLREFSATLARTGQELSSIAADPYQARLLWKELAQSNCWCVRARELSPVNEMRPRAIRFGMWSIPISCSFVGGHRRSIRSQLRACQKRLIDTARHSGSFHIVIDVANDRESWNEESAALAELLRTAADLSRQGRVRCHAFSEIPSVLARPRGLVSSRSILRAA